MQRLVLAVAIVASALCGTASAWGEGDTPNKFMVKWSALPFTGFHTMPRTVQEAQKDKFVVAQSNAADKTTVWCRDGDHRVCVLFDQKGSVAGIQLSVAKSELEGAKAAPLNAPGTPEWRRQTLMGVDVYTSTAYFVSKDVLLAGGRTMTPDTLTAPAGIYILQTNQYGQETNRLLVSNNERDAPKSGFTPQACFIGMGKHYFQELKKDNKCTDHRAYFLLYGPKTSKLNGFGFTWYGKPSTGKRSWFENPPALAAKMIAPNSPDCMTDWINKYGMFTMHVFFIDRPYLTTC